MKFSNLFFRTLREVPSDAEVLSHQLLLRAGFIRQTGAGIFSSLHLAKRTITKIENILRQEMDKIGGQEITMPVVVPASIWKETGRWYKIGSEMGRFVDRQNRDMVLSMTHEEAVADLVRSEIQSYKQLPQLIYHIQTKWRDDPRPRAGLIRVREFTMKDSYSLDQDWAGLEKQYRAHFQAYFDIFHRCDLPVISVKSDTGMMGGKLAHEYMYLTPIGEDTLILCDQCGYTANRQVAAFKKTAISEEKLKDLEKVATPAMKTIDELSEFLGVSKAKTAKAVFMVATIAEGEEDHDELVFAVIRGDMDINETKLSNALGAKALRPAHEEEIAAIGAVPGFASPIGIKGVTIVVDDSIPPSPNLVAGANETDYHYLNVNYGRDFKADIIADLSVAEEGHPCHVCGNSLTASRGVEVGNIFQLGTFYSDKLGCTYLDANGKPQPVIMGSYGIGVGRLLACVVEEHNDEFGIKWPISIAPYQVHLVGMRGAEEEADALYEALQSAGVEVLYDDRNERPGVKFNDADLMGLPLRLTVSKRSLESGGYEFKLRSVDGRDIIAKETAVEFIQSEIARLQSEIDATVVPVPYDNH
jgi:prolyl-tRNA synthetase